MATFVDISILQNFSSVFTFILVFVIIYSMLEVTNALGPDKKSMNAIIAMIVAFLVSLSTGVVNVIQSFTPWFTMLIVIIFFILFAVRIFGVSSETITAAFTKKSAILTWILILTAVILLFSLGSGFGQKTLEQGQSGGTTVSVQTNTSTVPTDTGSFSQNLYNTLYHPKVLGLILIMLVVVMAMLLLTASDTP
jgi:4-amino-4-deoxy-L-arabinose transferase-like glycosyltransferase